MLVKEILAFIKSFPGKEISPLDETILADLQSYFSKKKPAAKLVAEDIEQIVHAYTKRWQIDSERDYTRYPDGINGLWIGFAKDLTEFLASEQGKHLVDGFNRLLTKGNEKRSLSASVENRYLSLLFPTIVNAQDYHDVSSLTETTQSVGNFYLNTDGSVLYRKRSLCEHLVLQGFQLSTVRNLNKKILSPMTLKELARLKLCQASAPSFSIGSEKFNDFWDFLNQKSFPKLQSEHSEIPISLLPHIIDLLALVDEYFLQEQNGKFAAFKKKFAVFTDALYKKKLGIVNYFYGMKVDLPGEEKYLLDYLVAMETAEDFTIEAQMNGLAAWLFKYHHSLKSLAPKLSPIYSALPKGKAATRLHESDASSANTSCRATSPDINIAQYGCSLVVSVFVYDFKTEWVGEHLISVWDKKKVVPKLVYTIFERLALSIHGKTPNTLNEVYSEVVRTYVKPAMIPKDHFFAEATGSQTINTWLTHVQARSLHKLGFFWFEPEVILEALYKYKTDSYIAQQIKSVLDNLMSTYNKKSMPELIKRIRVNIIFLEFLTTLEEGRDKRYLVLLLDIHSIEHAKAHFRENSIKYVSRRLAELAGVAATKEDKDRFVALMDISELSFDSPAGASTPTPSVASVINNFSKILNKNSRCFSSTQYEAMAAYLFELNRAILSVEQDKSATQTRSEHSLGWNE